MKLVTFTHPQQRGVRLGALVGGARRIVDLQAAYQARYGKRNRKLTDMQALIEAGHDGLDLAAALLKKAPPDATLTRSHARLLAPVPRPLQMRDCMLFEKHVIQAMASLHRMRKLPGAPAPRAPDAWYAQPIYYKQNRMGVIGTETEIEWPHYSNLMDYELELGLFIGKTGKDISQARAREHFFGFTIFNDISARDAQSIEMAGQLGPCKGKDFDTGNVLGPCIVTMDEIGDPYQLAMSVKVNGELRGQGNSSSIHHTFEAALAHISRSETVYAGEFIGSGTVGDGCGLEQMRFLEDGDSIEMEIEKIGVLRNRIVRRLKQG